MSDNSATNSSQVPLPQTVMSPPPKSTRPPTSAASVPLPQTMMSPPPKSSRPPPSAASVPLPQTMMATPPKSTRPPPSAASVPLPQTMMAAPPPSSRNAPPKLAQSIITTPPKNASPNGPPKLAQSVISTPSHGSPRSIFPPRPKEEDRKKRMGVPQSMMSLPSRGAASSTSAQGPPVTMLMGRDSPKPPSAPPVTMVMGRDGPKAPSGPPVTMLLGRDSSRPPPSVKSAPPPVTMLMGRDKRPELKPEPIQEEPESEADDELPPGPPPASRFAIPDNTPIKPIKDTTIFDRRPHASITASILSTPKDFKMAAKQLQIESMSEKERAYQEDWAFDMLVKSNGCPENYDWVRRPGGYQCVKGGHGITDELLAEGLGGILASKDCTWEKMKGPYYPNPNGDGWIEGQLPKG